jgi:hypothetical protein
MESENKAGCKLRLSAIQVLELKSGGGKDAAGHGFDKEEGYEPDEASTSRQRGRRRPCGRWRRLGGVLSPASVALSWSREGYRSGLEEQLAQQLTEAGVVAEYEIDHDPLREARQSAPLHARLRPAQRNHHRVQGQVRCG